MKHKALGKGLSALITSQPLSQEGRIQYISLEAIHPSPNQPRRIFDEQDLRSLALSIKNHGVILPVIVRSQQNQFELIAGERRWRAARLAGLEKIPAIIKKVEDALALELALIENLLRKDLNPIEEASAYQLLIKGYGMTQDLVAEKVGKDRSTITNLLRLLKLPMDVQDLVVRGKISAGHAKALLGLPSNGIIFQFASLTVQHQWSVRVLEEKVRKMTEKMEICENSRKENMQDPNLDCALSSIRNRFSTKVQIKHNRNGRGYIHLEFYSGEDLNRILELLGGG